MAKERKDKIAAKPKTCPICDGVLDLDGLCRGNYRCSKAVSHEQSMACRKIVTLVVDGKLAECEAQERIQGILHPEVPF